MAGRVEIQRGRDKAKADLIEALTRLSVVAQVPVVAINSISYRRDPNYEEMARLQALGQWAQGIADALAPKKKRGKKAEKKAEQPEGSEPPAEEPAESDEA
jgi:hypothetical protein